MLWERGPARECKVSFSDGQPIVTLVICYHNISTPLPALRWGKNRIPAKKKRNAIGLDTKLAIIEDHQHGTKVTAITQSMACHGQLYQQFSKVRKLQTEATATAL